MGVKMSDNMKLQNGPCAVELAAPGAEIMAWRIDGRDLLWHGDPAFWPRRSPVLFPFCGWTSGGRFRALGRSYATGVHGFAHTAPFHLERLAQDAARMTLADTPASLALFPFRFSLAIDVMLDESSVHLDFTVANPGTIPLPFALGYHPGFRWPFDGGRREEYRLEFAAPERPTVPVIAPGGLFSPQTLHLPFDGRVLDPVAALALQDSLVLRDAASASVDFIAPSGRRIRIASEGFPHWVLWSKPEGGYLCIERWSGEGDPVGFTGDITEKPGQNLLPPGETRRFSFACTFID